MDVGAGVGGKQCDDHYSPGTAHVLGTSGPHTHSLAESSQQPDAGIYLLLWMRKLRFRGWQLVLCHSWRRSLGFGAMPACQEKLGPSRPGPQPQALGQAEQPSSPWPHLHLEGLGREQDTVNLEQTFILCAGLVGPWPQVSGN